MIDGLDFCRKIRDSRNVALHAPKKTEFAKGESVFQEKNGGDDGTRTRGLCRDRAP